MAMDVDLDVDVDVAGDVAMDVDVVATAHRATEGRATP